VYGEFYLCNSGRNYSGICDPEVDALFERQSQTLDVNERRRLVWEMEKKAVGTQSKVILLWRLDRTIHWANVRNYRRHPSLYNNQRMEGVWLAEG